MTSTFVRPVGQQALGLIVLLALTFSAAALGAVASAQAGTFYAALVRPEWAPPGWLFAPVWTLLYTLMALAAWLVWRSAPWTSTRAAMALYALQLLANALWTWLFFAAQSGLWALLEILVLVGLIVVCMAHFRRFSAWAFALLCPYLAWVGFATLLTGSIWRLNPSTLG